MGKFTIIKDHNTKQVLLVTGRRENQLCQTLLNLPVHQKVKISNAFTATELTCSLNDLSSTYTNHEQKTSPVCFSD